MKRTRCFLMENQLEMSLKWTDSWAVTEPSEVLLVLWLFVGHSFLDDDGMMSFLQHVRSNPGAWCTATTACNNLSHQLGGLMFHNIAVLVTRPTIFFTTSSH